MGSEGPGGVGTSVILLPSTSSRPPLPILAGVVRLVVSVFDDEKSERDFEGHTKLVVVSRVLNKIFQRS